jgi:hypothetical protein
VTGRFTVYGLRPDRRFIAYRDDLETAELDARTLVERGHYRETEVWDRTLRAGEGAQVSYFGKPPDGSSRNRRAQARRAT